MMHSARTLPLPPVADIVEGDLKDLADDDDEELGAGLPPNGGVHVTILRISVRHRVRSRSAF